MDMARSVTLAIYMAIEGLLMYAVLLLAMAMKMATRDGFPSTSNFRRRECLRDMSFSHLRYKEHWPSLSVEKGSLGVVILAINGDL